MAETVHPRLNSASASTSSPTDNMAGGSSCWSASSPPASGSPPPKWRTLQWAHHSVQGWGISVIDGGGISVIRSNRAGSGVASVERRHGKGRTRASLAVGKADSIGAVLLRLDRQPGPAVDVED